MEHKDSKERPEVGEADKKCCERLFSLIFQSLLHQV